MEGGLLQFGGSLVAILALAAIAWRLGLGPSSQIEGEDHAMRLADEADSSFDAAQAAVARDGHAAIVADRDGALMVVRPHGARFAARRLAPGARVACESGMLTVDTGDRRFGPDRGTATLDLGDAADIWVCRIRALHGHDDA